MAMEKELIEYRSRFPDLPIQILTVCVTRMSEYMHIMNMDKRAAQSQT